MHRAASRQALPRPAGFALTASVIFAVGLLSALIDGTLGWEYLAREMLVRLAH
jgi:hypothetical protein